MKITLPHVEMTKVLNFGKKKEMNLNLINKFQILMKKEFIKYYLIQKETYILVQKIILSKSGN